LHHHQSLILVPAPDLDPAIPSAANDLHIGEAKTRDVRGHHMLERLGVRARSAWRGSVAASLMGRWDVRPVEELLDRDGQPADLLAPRPDHDLDDVARDR
jgi:hypothetical protein